ncbi:SUMF1/EgtB/PvdO family nonheme iron enzyme [Lelliottia sp. V89_10]|uniref:formylglycine-generating enzyme family protein n=1 Tax=Lelliottia wanjuensis TaxID=3050585 RepID=UPI00249F742B|nr:MULTISPECIES: SUMF1/EgtB/PvdO family nonheme iron enzyme [unclassified Lelliottia]MDI3360054.1 SUMF1/EgtB/PvdO family nonheme iron enzyme [Lelliottia sp. V89_13]MDK9548280.1 SUMF1/EgtB/PvdO family nonheme iron enzyme [Lelliottia sp. V89_5]MDK9594880.1 SUMF1/EgtB/PvdO family nonheme iron enzyme [Lelliottia sp. V89_10]
MNKNYLWFPILISISACDQKPSENPIDQKAVDALVQQSLNKMVDIQGGSFMMGDFGPLVGEKLPLTGNDDDKDLHKVTLSDFAMGKYKVTYKEYDEYSVITHSKKITPLELWIKDYPRLRNPDMPAVTTWQQAKDYCQWLGEKSGKKIDLPTEAQWEYAARNRGQNVAFATNNGEYKLGVNIATNDQKVTFSGIYGFSFTVGKFPATPLGLYDMAGNGVDWMNDWYAEDYYAKSPEFNPQGPDKGQYKVIRGYLGGGGPFTNHTVYRQFVKPDPTDKETGIAPIYNFRCVENK